MGYPKTSVDALQRAIDAWARHDRSPTRAARELGIARSTLSSRLQEAKARNLKPRIRVPAMSLYYEVPTPPPSIFCEPDPDEVTASEMRITAIGDEHDSPDMPKDRFTWIGKHIAAQAPDRVVRIGDIANFDSLSFHDANDTVRGRYKPFFMADLESLDRAQEALHEPIAQANLTIVEHLTLGNHENRIWRFENATPELAGMLQRDFTDLLKKYGIRWYEYGRMLMLGGVGFSHAPFSVMNRPIMGMTAAQTIGRQAIHDVVKGHSHKADVHSAPKVGEDNVVRVFDLGCALPWGHVQAYAKHSVTGWWFGACDLTIRNGRVTGWNYIPMHELQRRYG